MPLFDFRCDQCGLEFEVSRPLSRAEEPAFCPVDNAACERIESSSGAFVRQSERPPGDLPRRPQPSGGFAHFGHSHGPGAGAHSH
jgi:putative FmdB family regulatory protein